MNILFITHRFPYPPNRGDSIRSFHFLKRFSEMGSVTLASLYEQPPSAESETVLKTLCSEIIISRWGQRRKWLRAGGALLRGKTMTEGLFFNRKLRHELRECVVKTRFDGIVVFCSSMFQYLDVLQGTPNEKTPVVVDLVDVDSQKWYDYAARSRNWKRYIFHTEGKRLRRLETRIGNRCDALLAVTPEEIALYRSFSECTCSLAAVPNGVDTQFFDPKIPELAELSEIPKRLVFVGALDYHANVDGVEWFVKNVFPPLRERFSDCVFDVVGSRPAAVLKSLAENTPGMNLVGTVPDVRPYLKRAAAAVIPLQVARGLQNKVLEACSMERPTVTSTCAAEGIEPETQSALRICRTPKEWLETLTELFQDTEARQNLGRLARLKAEKHYGWNAQLNVLESVLRTAAEKNA